ncbi:Ataxin-7, partial [Ophiophagus hannah]
MTPSVKVEKIHPKLDGALLKPAVGPTCSTTVSSSIKTGLNPSIPKPPLPSPGQILNGKSLLSVPPYTEKKQDESTNNRKFLHKRLSEREFDPDIYCGVIDTETKKPCTRSLTCKTHSLTQRRAVQGRRKRFDLLLAEHKSKTREKELLRHLDHHQQMPLLREPHPSPSRTSQELHQNSHGVIPTESKPLVPNKLKPHTPSLPRPPGCPGQHSGNAPSESPSLHESPHAPLPAAEPTSRLSSDEGECDEKEEPVEKLDCLYSDHHPQAAAFCTFGSRQIGRGYYVFDKRWNHIRCALNVMVDKHLNSQMWKKIPPATSNSASIRAPHRTSAMPASQYSVSTASSTFPTTAMSPPGLVVGHNCVTTKASLLSLKHDQSGRGPPTGSPAESIKRMSVMVNSGDSTLSLGPFIHQSSELTVNSHGGFSHSHPSLDKLIGKKRKGGPGSSSLSSSSSSSSKASKIAKLPPVNNIHTKHTGAIPGTQGLMNNSILHQV